MEMPCSTERGPLVPQAPTPPNSKGFVPVVQNPVVTTVTQVLAPPTDGPSMMFCTFCQRTITSRTSFEIGLMTWAVCGGLFLLGCFPCMCIPCCLDSCKDVMHYCPHCNRLLQTYKRM
ncbi:hypothetical protein OJAV_G00077480 [Oryzias javanicus]|uniref:LITAF domain-containing protein n=1 Tax=Oryzias javanicus TaxID=123683 RepID=A0A3S2UEU8_ORYJA|nr:hypothetical protein OJAV_G00077480 [Oryzias javanicus]